MSVISGKSGLVNGKGSIRTWGIDPVHNPQEYVDSGTKGAKARLFGNKDWRGNYSAYGHTPEALPGEPLSFVGVIDGSDGVQGTAIVDEVAITVDIEAAAIIAHTVAFSGNGTLNRGTVSGSAGSEAIYSSQGRKLLLESIGEVSDVRTMTLTMRRDNPAYASSGTAGEMRRIAGNLDLQFSYTQYIDDFSALPDGTIKAVKMYVESAKFWEIEWVLFGEATGLVVERETGALVAATLNGYFTAIKNGGVGKIVKPSGAPSWWPPA